jgi:hypothetical protein
MKIKLTSQNKKIMFYCCIGMVVLILLILLLVLKPRLATNTQKQSNPILETMEVGVSNGDVSGNNISCDTQSLKDEIDEKDNKIAELNQKILSQDETIGTYKIKMDEIDKKLVTERSKYNAIHLKVDNYLGTINADKTQLTDLKKSLEHITLLQDNANNATINASKSETHLLQLYDNYKTEWNKSNAATKVAKAVSKQKSDDKTHNELVLMNAISQEHSKNVDAILASSEAAVKQAITNEMRKQQSFDSWEQRKAISDALDTQPKIDSQANQQSIQNAVKTALDNQIRNDADAQKTAVISAVLEAVESQKEQDTTIQVSGIKSAIKSGSEAQLKKDVKQQAHAVHKALSEQAELSYAKFEKTISEKVTELMNAEQSENTQNQSVELQQAVSHQQQIDTQAKIDAIKKGLDQQYEKNYNESMEAVSNTIREIIEGQYKKRAEEKLAAVEKAVSEQKNKESMKMQLIVQNAIRNALQSNATADNETKSKNVATSVYAEITQEHERMLTVMTNAIKLAIEKESTNDTTEQSVSVTEAVLQVLNARRAKNTQALNDALLNAIRKADGETDTSSEEAIVAQKVATAKKYKEEVAKLQHELDETRSNTINNYREACALHGNVETHVIINLAKSQEILEKRTNRLARINQSNPDHAHEYIRQVARQHQVVMKLINESVALKKVAPCDAIVRVQKMHVVRVAGSTYLDHMVKHSMGARSTVPHTHKKKIKCGDNQVMKFSTESGYVHGNISECTEEDTPHEEQEAGLDEIFRPATRGNVGDVSGVNFNITMTHKLSPGASRQLNSGFNAIERVYGF